MRRAFFQRQTQVIGELDRLVNPPPPPEPTIVYITEEQGSSCLGDPDFDVRLMKKPHRWFR
jgi:hypothetical protein